MSDTATGIVRTQTVWGLMAEFADEEALLEGTRRAYEAGYRAIESYSPHPVDGLAEAMGFRSSAVPRLTLMGGILGAAAGFGLQYYTAVIDYPLNVGGRPLNSWPAFIPITFEMMVLTAGLIAVIGMLAINGLPQPYHPVFNAPRFAEHGSLDRFYLCIRSDDAKYDPAVTRAFLESLEPSDITEVAP
jgi:hypothetical protein